MAITALPYNTFVANGNLSDPTGVSISAGASNRGQVPSVPAAFTKVGSVPELTLLRVSNASGGSGTLTVKAGANPPAVAGGQGDLVVTVANSGVQWVGPFESGRFLQTDGSILVEASVAMTVTAFKVPRGT